MRRINAIVLHVSASKASQKKTAADIDREHRNRRPPFRCIGYHYYIRLDGILEKGRPEEEIGAHVKGHNRDTIGICLEGGIDEDGNYADIRTLVQEQVLVNLLKVLKEKYPDAKFKGHRDYSPDLNGDGKIDKHEWTKFCPGFNVESEYGWI